jgi:hypothetical protein
VPYLKFSRDKRGYEHFYLVQPSNRGKGRPRVLYWFRTPPGVKVGRLPFDQDMRRALEAQNPDVVFDWETIVNTPIPPPMEPERWRERRRIERVFKAASEEEEPRAIAHVAAIVEEAAEPSAVELVRSVEPAAIEQPAAAAEQTLVGESPGPGPSPGPGTGAQRRRRRRRGRRKPPGNPEPQNHD